MKIPKKYSYVIFAIVMYVGGLLGMWVSDFLGGFFTFLGAAGGLVVFAIAVYPTYILVKRTESEW